MHAEDKAHLPTEVRPLTWAENLLIFLGVGVLIALFGAVCSSCVATQEYVESRVNQLSDKVDERIVAGAQVTEDTLLLRRDPLQLSDNVELAVELKPLPPPTEEQTEFPWTETGISLALAVASYFGVNIQRNRKRRRRGEPVTPEDAEIDNELWLDAAAKRAEERSYYRQPVEPMTPMDPQAAGS